MEKLFGEFLTTLIIFGVVVLLAIYKSKSHEKVAKINERDFKKNLENFALFFDEKGESFDEICKNLAKSGKIKIIDKNMSVSDFVGVLGRENFSDEIGGTNKIDQKILSQCVRALKKPLALGLYPQNNGVYYAFLLDEDELFRLIDLASKVGENIIFCD
ncbi:hypothetical protein [Campylobacter gastrosuis]|uniref:Periplasmic protein n=1 Tax=Campylobacter gastrosuis TaxID=2974576 RepID=A0ABT7HQ86_9BACT|nr:hypothetical protein [Campylobacter gastrosuis]MDL0088788.1 hypothetical protein [Campylobacter gastrosuis]